MTDISSELERIRDLHASGAISDNEYESAKAKALSGGNKAKADDEPGPVAYLATFAIMGVIAWWFFTPATIAQPSAMFLPQGTDAPYELGVSMLEDEYGDCRVSFRFTNVADILLPRLLAHLEIRDAGGNVIATSGAISRNIRVGGIGTDSRIIENVSCSEIASIHAISGLAGSIVNSSLESLIPIET